MQIDMTKANNSAYKNLISRLWNTSWEEKVSVNTIHTYGAAHYLTVDHVLLN